MTAAFSIGMGRYALDAAVAYARTRQVWKAPIGAHQAIAHPLAQAHIELELARLMMQKAASCTTPGTTSARARPPTWRSTRRARPA